MRVIRHLIKLSFILVASVPMHGQTGGINPYSVYGLGWNQSRQLTYGQMLGEASSAWRSALYVNPAQPASYADLRFTTLDLGGFYQSMHQSNTENALWNSTGGFREFAIAMPLHRRIGLAAGLRPYTMVAYDMYTEDSSDTFGKVSRGFRGSGGLSETYVGLAWRPAKWFAIGANAYYRFGSQERNEIVQFEGSLLDDVHSVERVMVSGWNYEIGSQLTIPMGTTRMTLAATYEPTGRLNAWYDDYAYTFYENSAGGEVVRDSLVQAIGLEGYTYTGSQMTWGLSLQRPAVNLPIDAWTINLGYRSMNATEIVRFSTGTTGPSDYQENVQLYSGSMTIVPALAFPERYMKGYASQIAYRASFNSMNSGLVIEGNAVNQWNTTLGIGLPLGGASLVPGDRKFATLNLGMQLGQVGSHNNGLIQELQIRGLVGLTLNDQWFQERKYR